MHDTTQAKRDITLTLTSIIQRPCPKCRGTLTYCSDQYGPYIQCMQCARIIDLAVKQKRHLEPRPPAPNPTPRPRGRPTTRRP